MFDYKKLILTATLLSTVSSWVLKSTHIVVVPELTEDVMLKCYHESSKNLKVEMVQLTRIRLQKRVDTGISSKWVTLAEISVPSNSNVKLSKAVSLDIIVSGYLGKPDESFLSVTWPTADDAIVGTYMCQVDGLEEDLRAHVHLSTQTVTVTSLVHTTTELADIMIKMKQEIQSKIEDNFLEVRYWPAGNYSLLSPASGCPDTPYFKWGRGYAKIKTETKHEPTYALSSPNHFHADVIERNDSRNFLHLRFCNNPIPDYQVAMWPRGSYCIHMHDFPVCPQGFNKGYTDAYLENFSRSNGKDHNLDNVIDFGSNYLTFHFCCRDDGDPNFPVLLPNKMPFYLLRYKGRCQNVRNMDVSEEWIRLDSLPNDNSNHDHPDIELNDVVLRLCYYSNRPSRSVVGSEETPSTSGL